MAILGGLYAPDGRVMGHAGAFEYPWETDEGGNGVIRKHSALDQAGVVLVDHPEKFGDGMKTLLAQRHVNSPSRGAKRAVSCIPLLLSHSPELGCSQALARCKRGAFTLCESDHGSFHRNGELINYDRYTSNNRMHLTCSKREV